MGGGEGVEGKGKKRGNGKWELHAFDCSHCLTFVLVDFVCVENSSHWQTAECNVNARRVIHASVVDLPMRLCIVAHQSVVVLLLCVHVVE